MRKAIELPLWDGVPGDVEAALAQIDAWAGHLRDHPVVAEFSHATAHLLRGLHGAELLEALESFAAVHWDFRHGRERNLAHEPEFSPPRVQVITEAAHELGLAGTAPPRCREYDAVVMTGGMVRAGIVKPRYLRELVDSGLEWREGIFLGGFRPFAGDELMLAPILGVDGNNEFDSMTAGMRHAFGLGLPDFVDGSDPATGSPPGAADWREESWEWRGRMLRVIAAPSSAPQQRRSNTADTYRFWASRVDGIRSVLVVTTPIYVPYQGAAAIEVLGIEFGFSVETVAVSATASNLGVHSQAFLPHHQVQEIRSALHGFHRLRSRLVSLKARD